MGGADGGTGGVLGGKWRQLYLNNNKKCHKNRKIKIQKRTLRKKHKPKQIKLKHGYSFEKSLNCYSLLLF